jgi:hypothetical protein
VISRRRRFVAENENYKSEINVFRSKSGRSRENCWKSERGKGKLLLGDRENPDGAGKISKFRRLLVSRK